MAPEGYLRHKQTHVRMKGTLERLEGCAYATRYVLEDGEIKPLYCGETDVWWDGQETQCASDGLPYYVGDDGHIYHENDLEFVQTA